MRLRFLFTLGFIYVVYPNFEQISPPLTNPFINKGRARVSPNKRRLRAAFSRGLGVTTLMT
jgi:hypothetical protein